MQKKALEDKNSIFYYYKKLIRLRHEEEILTEGTFKLLLEEDKNIFAYERKWKEKEWLIVANLSENNISLEPLKPYLYNNSKTMISNYDNICVDNQLKSFEAFIIEKTK